MQSLLRLSRGIDALNRRVGRFAAWLTLAMVLVGSLNAVLRYLFEAGSNTWIELQWYLFSMVFLLGAALTLQENAHVRVDVLYGRLSAKAKAWIDLVGLVLLLIPFCAFGVWINLEWVRASWTVWEQSSDPGGLPRYPLKTLVPIAFLLLLLQGVAELVKRVAILRGMDVDATDEAGGHL